MPPRGSGIEKRSKAQLERPRCSDGAVQGRDTAGRLPGFQGHRRGDGTQEAVLTEGAHAALSRRDERCRSQGVLGDGGQLAPEGVRGAWGTSCVSRRRGDPGLGQLRAAGGGDVAPRHQHGPGFLVLFRQ